MCSADLAGGRGRVLCRKGGGWLGVWCAHGRSVSGQSVLAENSGNIVGDQLAFKLCYTVLEKKFPFFQALEVQLVDKSGLACHAVDDGIQVTMFAAEFMKLAQHNVPISQHDGVSPWHNRTRLRCYGRLIHVVASVHQPSARGQTRRAKKVACVQRMSACGEI